MKKKTDKYSKVIEDVFFSLYKEKAEAIKFTRKDIENVAIKLDIKNLGDILYSFRMRKDLPERIKKCAPKNKEWVIRLAGRGIYTFALTDTALIIPSKILSVTKIPDATPGIIEKYALSDEQALLAKLRYNRLIDIFTGVTCYSLQSHLRTAISSIGQIETDELYIGIDKRGAHYVFPVQAKGRNDKLGIVQIEQDFSMCFEKFPNLICYPIGAQFSGSNLIALFSFEKEKNQVVVSSEKHYRLVPPEEMTPADLENYNKRPL